MLVSCSKAEREHKDGSCLPRLLERPTEPLDVFNYNPASGSSYDDSLTGLFHRKTELLQSLLPLLCPEGDSV